MRVIMTGFTALQRGPERRGDIRKIDVPGTVAEKLRDAGHEVDWRPVELGEDLSVYEVAWVNLARPISMNSRVGALGAMWTLASGIPCVGFYDDWQSPVTVQNDFRIMTRRPNFVQKHIVDPKALRQAAGIEQATYLDRAPALAAVEDGRMRLLTQGYSRRDADKLRAYRFYDEDYDTVETYKPELERLIWAMADGTRWAAGMVPVCPMYRWGNRSIVQRILPKGSLPLVPLDPSETAYDMVQDYRNSDGALARSQKRREWLLSALMPHDQWLRKQTLAWPVWNTGSQSMIRRLGQGERLFSEVDVLQRYAERWGVLSPPYREHAGSGWWRSRFIYAAATGCVVSADVTEVGLLGMPYAHSAQEIEGMSTSELRRIASWQAGVMEEHAPSDGDVLVAAETALRLAVGTDRWQA